jgi:hypothetical protein
MLFPGVRPSRKTAIDEIKTALEGDRSAVYLDANVLIHCYEMSALASEDLLRGLERYGDRVRVPLWAARETWTHLRGLTSSRPLKKLAEKVRSSLERFRSETTRYLHDGAVRGMGDDYHQQLSEAIDKTLSLVQLVGNYEPKIDQTTARLLPFMETRHLTSDLRPILKEVAETAALRAAHHVPPGFKDAPQQVAVDMEEDHSTPPSRKGKTFNPHGDLINWLEILKDCDAHGVEQLIFVTRDVTKGDWVYAPDMVLNDKGQPQRNNHLLTLPHPLLAQEARQRCPTLKGVHVISVEMLAHIWNDMGVDVGNLVTALQTNASPTIEGPVLINGGAVETAPDYRPSFESSDMIYEPDPNDDLDRLIIDLEGEGWTAQNDAVRRLESQLTNLNRAQRIQVGRGIVSAANEGAREPAELLERVLDNERLGRPLRSEILIGALAEIYIAEDGVPKKPLATSGIIASLFKHQNRATLSEAYEVVLGRLRPVRRKYLALPRDAQQQIALEFSLHRGELVSLSVGSVPLLEQDAPSSRTFRRRGRGLEMGIADLVGLIADEFIVPPEIFVMDLSMTANIAVPGDNGFINWGPQTGVLLR